MAKLQLEVGQTVWIEYKEVYSNATERKINKAEIISINKSSAYYVTEYMKNKYPDGWETSRWMWDRIDLKTRKIQKSVLGFFEVLWLTEEEFNDDVAKEKEQTIIKSDAKEKFNGLSMKELKRFVEEF